MIWEPMRLQDLIRSRGNSDLASVVRVSDLLCYSIGYEDGVQKTGSILTLAECRRLKMKCDRAGQSITLIVSSCGIDIITVLRE